MPHSKLDRGELTALLRTRAREARLLVKADASIGSIIGAIEDMRDLALRLASAPGSSGQPSNPSGKD